MVGTRAASLPNGGLVFPPNATTTYHRDLVVALAARYRADKCRFVEMKTEDQLDMQTLHRSRERLVGERTALINQLRAILLDRGIVVPQGNPSWSNTWSS